MARYPSDLKTIINRYAGESASIPAARINRDFRIAIVATASEVVADVLATTIRSPKTPAFPEVLVELYENSPKAVRADLFNIIIDAMPEAEPLLPRRLRRRRRRFTAQHVVDVTGLDIKMFGEAIEPMPSVFDAVSSFYARHYRPLLKLPTDFQRNLLTNYSSAGRHIALAQNVVEPDFATKNFEITDNLAIDSGEPPTTVKPQVAEGQEPDRALMAPPRPRYASVRV